MKMNLLKKAGDLQTVGGTLLKSDRWHRQTVYHTNDKMPIVMTHDSSFVSINPETRRFSRNPQATYVTIAGVMKRLNSTHPLPNDLRMRLKLPPVVGDYSPTDDVQLYSKIRNESAGDYKKRIRNQVANTRRFDEIRVKVELNPSKVTANDVRFLQAFSNDPNANYYRELAHDIFHRPVSVKL